jgi:hypothetical protein
LNQEHGDRENQQDVNESAEGVRTNQSQHPQDKQYNGNGPQHFESPISTTWWLENRTAYSWQTTPPSVCTPPAINVAPT